MSSAAVVIDAFRLKNEKKQNQKSINIKEVDGTMFTNFACSEDSTEDNDLVHLYINFSSQVENVSESNDEGITALHNAICAGHYEIVTFLVEFGCDVNSPDSDGW